MAVRDLLNGRFNHCLISHKKREIIKKENQKVLGLFKYQPLGFGIHLPMKSRVTLV